MLSFRRRVDSAHFFKRTDWLDKMPMVMGKKPRASSPPSDMIESVSPGYFFGVGIVISMTFTVPRVESGLSKSSFFPTTRIWTFPG